MNVNNMKGRSSYLLQCQAVVPEGSQQALFLNRAQHLRADLDADPAVLLRHVDALGDDIDAPLLARLLVAVADVVAKLRALAAYRTLARHVAAPL